MKPARREDWLVLAGRFGIVIVFALAWEVLGRMGKSDPELLPPLSKVLATLWQLLHDPDFMVDLRVTLVEIAAAFAIVAPLGLLIGFVVGENQRLYDVVNPTIQLMMATPKAIFLPIFIIAFGIGFTEKVVFSTMIGLFAVILAGIAAVHSVPQGLVTAARSFGVNRRQLYLQIYLPAMTPLIIGGLRLGLVFTIFGVLLSEMYAASNGVGHAFVAWGESYRMPELMAGVLLIVVITVALDEMMRLAEEHYGKWRKSAR
ncbi:MAG TPA: ABC transporter permease [Alphaproteobacteria bacterium]|nr:ABC transporter permease [Alphaproteobacteria bacterium]